MTAPGAPALGGRLRSLGPTTAAEAARSDADEQPRGADGAGLSFSPDGSGRGIGGRLGAAGPDFFIVGHAKSGTTARCTRCCAPPADLHARVQGAVVLRHRAALDATAARGGGTRDARGVPGAVRRRAGRASASARPRPPICGRTRPRARIAEAAAGRADHRDPARARELPALAAHAVRAERTSRPRRTCARRSRSSPRGAQAGRSRATPLARRRCCYSEHVRYVEQLRRYHECFAPRAGAGADLRGLPRRQRGAPCGAVLRFLEVDDTRADRGGRGEPDGRACARSALDELVRSLYRRRRPGVARRASAAVKARHAAAAAPRALRGARRRRRARRPAACPTRS